MTDLQLQRESSLGDADATPILRARDIHKHYRLGSEDLHILRGVDLEVRPKEWLAILGKSGSGKSTLLHILGGLDRPDRGEVHYEGRNVFTLGGSKLDFYRNRNVGFVFQFYHLLPELTALENVLISAQITRGIFAWPAARAAVRRRATELLDLVGLTHRMKHRPAKLSGGERQRVAIARALINDPAVLLADEPTGNLDAETGATILELFRNLHRAGQTMVLVTHDNTVAAAADRQVRLERGQLATAAD